MYKLLALIVTLVLLLILGFIFLKISKKNQRKPEDIKNRRSAYRLHVKNKACNIQPLFSNSKQTAAIRDISASGIRIETSDSLTEKSLLLIYFHLDDETFIVEGLVKRKQPTTPHSAEYGIKFINLTAKMEENLHKKLWSMNKKIAQ